MERLWTEVSNSNLPVSREGFEEFIEQLHAGLHTPLPRRKKTPVPMYRRPSPREVAWLLTRKDEELSSSERGFLTELERECPETVEIRRLAANFARMVRDRCPEMFDSWLQDALNNPIEEFGSLAASIGKDEAAVRAALSLSWSNGPVEGFIHKLKLLKRQMYGRANFDFLRSRTLNVL